jgi:uncharacterized protein YcfL
MMRATLLVLAALLIAGCAKKPDVEKIEQRQNQQMIRMG